MAIDIKDPRTLAAVTEEMKRPASVMRGMFFKEQAPSNTRTLDVKKITRSRPRGIMVNPIVQGHVVTRGGYTMETVTPGYFREKMTITPTDALVTRANEQIGGSMTPGERVAAMRGQDLAELRDRIDRNIEIMCGECMWTGKVNCYEWPEGAAAPVLVRQIDFELPADHNVTLGTPWSDAAADILEQLATGCRKVQDDSGLVADTLILSTDLIQYFVHNTKIKVVLDNRRMDGTNIAFAPYGNRVSFVGTINYADVNLKVMTYSEAYNDFDGTLTRITPAKKGGLFCTSAPYELHWGAIMNLKAMNGGRLAEGRYFPLTWAADDGSAEWMQMESSPLACNLQPKSSYIFQALA